MAPYKGYELENKTVLVTGANRGIGKALVEAFVEGGAAKVYASARNIETAQPLVAAYPNQVFALQLDLSDPSSIEKAAKEAQDVQILVNNAGVLHRNSALSEKALSNLKHELEINVSGYLNVGKFFLMRNRCKIAVNFPFVFFFFGQFFCQMSQLYLSSATQLAKSIPGMN